MIRASSFTVVPVAKCESGIGFNLRGKFEPSICNPTCYVIPLFHADWKQPVREMSVKGDLIFAG